MSSVFSLVNFQLGKNVGMPHISFYSNAIRSIHDDVQYIFSVKPIVNIKKIYW